jgi:hypothetical protein
MREHGPLELKTYSQHVKETYLERAAALRENRFAKVDAVAPTLKMYQDATHWPRTGIPLPQSLAALAQKRALPYTATLDSWLLDRVVQEGTWEHRLACAVLISLLSAWYYVVGRISTSYTVYLYVIQAGLSPHHIIALLWLSGVFLTAVFVVSICMDCKLYLDVIRFGRHHKFLHFLYLSAVLPDGRAAESDRTDGHVRSDISGANVIRRDSCVARFWDGGVRIYRLHQDGAVAEEVLSIAEECKTGDSTECRAAESQLVEDQKEVIGSPLDCMDEC